MAGYKHKPQGPVRVRDKTPKLMGGKVVVEGSGLPVSKSQKPSRPTKK